MSLRRHWELCLHTKQSVHHITRFAILLASRKSFSTSAPILNAILSPLAIFPMPFWYGPANRQCKTAHWAVTPAAPTFTAVIPEYLQVPTVTGLDPT